MSDRTSGIFRRECLPSRETCTMPGVVGLLVRHEAWCPLAYGEGRQCVCDPAFELVDVGTLAATAKRDFRNRAQRRATTKAKATRGGKR